MVIELLGQSLFPGNEQNYYWGSFVANTAGSKNFAGVSDPVVDDLVARLIVAQDSDERNAIGRALDRILLWGFYAIPHFNVQTFRIAYWDKIAMPKDSPLWNRSLLMVGKGSMSVESCLNLKCYNNAFMNSKNHAFKEKYAPLFGFYQC